MDRKRWRCFACPIYVQKGNPVRRTGQTTGSVATASRCHQPRFRQFSQRPTDECWIRVHALREKTGRQFLADVVRHDGKNVRGYGELDIGMGHFAILFATFSMCQPK